MYPYVHGSTIYNSEDMEAIWMSTNRWIAKEDVVYTYTVECYSVIKKERNMPFAATWMGLEMITLSEVNQTNTMWYPWYVESKIWYKWIYLQNRNRLTDIETDGYQRGKGEGGIH